MNIENVDMNEYVVVVSEAFSFPSESPNACCVANQDTQVMLKC